MVMWSQPHVSYILAAIITYWFKVRNWIRIKTIKDSKKLKDQIFYNQLIKKVESNGRISGAQYR